MGSSPHVYLGLSFPSATAHRSPRLASFAGGSEGREQGADGISLGVLSKHKALHTWKGL